MTYYVVTTIAPYVRFTVIKISLSIVSENTWVRIAFISKGEKTMSKGYFNKKVKGFIFDYARKAKKISYGALRAKRNIIGVALHWTEGIKDTAQNECDYFATGNSRSAGAHIFIDRMGKTGFSIPLKYTAYAVMSKGYTSGAYDGILNNSNTVSIELCGCNDGYGNGLPMTDLQERSLYNVLTYIKKECPNVKHFVRHYDIKNKHCPKYYVDNREEWKHLKKYVEKIIFKG